MDIRQSFEWAKYMELLGWRVETLSAAGREWFVYIRPLYPIPLSIIKIQRISPSAFNTGTIEIIRCKYHAIVTYIEFDEPKASADGWEKLIKTMKAAGFKPTMDAMLPTKTRVVDLRLTEYELLAQMKPKTRYNIGLARRRGVKTKWFNGQQLLNNQVLAEQFFGLYQQNNRRIGVFGSPRSWFKAHLKSYGQKAWIGLALDPQDTLLAEAFFFESDKHLIYFYNGSTEEGRHDMAPTLLVWEAIQKGKQQGIEKLDFEGIYDERKPNKRWLGFSRFKEGFGGRVIYYPPALVKYGWPVFG